MTSSLTCAPPAELPSTNPQTDGSWWPPVRASPRRLTVFQIPQKCPSALRERGSVHPNRHTFADAAVILASMAAASGVSSSSKSSTRTLMAASGSPPTISAGIARTENVLGPKESIWKPSSPRTGSCSSSRRDFSGGSVTVTGSSNA